MSAVTVTVTMFSASSKAKENVLVKAAAVHDQHRSDRSHGAEYDTTYLSAIRLLLFTSNSLVAEKILSSLQVLGMLLVISRNISLSLLQ